MEGNYKKCFKFQELDKFICDKDNDESSLIAILHKAQELYGYLSSELQEFIAERLNIPLSKVYGVITFYSYFTMEPKGKYVISICTGTACFVRGASDILEEFKNILGIKEGETTQDGLFTLDILRCIGACGLAPVVSINNAIYGNLTREKVKGILKSFKE